MSVTSHALLWLAGLATVGAALQPTQDPSKQDPAKRPPPPQTPPPSQTTTSPAGMSTYALLEDLLGAEVVFERSPADADKTTKDKDTTKRGKVKDFAVATSDGKIAGIVVNGGDIDRTILLPASGLTCAFVDKKPVYTVRMSKAELDAHGEFDAKRAEKEGLDKDIERLRGMPGGKMTGGDTHKTSPEPGVAPDKDKDKMDKEHPMGAMAYVLGTQIKGCEINATDKHFGKVRDAAIDFRNNVVSHLMVSHGGVGAVGDSVYLVPFNAAMWGRDGDKPVLKLSKTVDEAKTAPEYKKPDQGFVTTEQMRASDAFWGGRKSTTSPG
jgi:sporulation protein YlmC with PRC-barrel domain